MKINAVGSSHLIINHKIREITPQTFPTDTTQQVPTSAVQISFMAGNKAQAIEWCVENKPYFQNGGVATAISDRRTLRVSEADPIITEARKKNIMKEPLSSKAFAMPLYNGSLKYEKENGILKSVEVPKIPAGLPKESPFKKYEGKYCLINHPKFHNYVDELEFFTKEGGKNPITGADNLKLNGNIFIMEEVKGAAKKMDFGGVGETNINLFRVYFDHNGKLVPTNDFQIFTDVPATWTGPYKEGGYASSSGLLSQTWKGNGDARGAKAFVELTEDLCADMSRNSTKFDPATIVCNDSQASYSIEYMAQKSAQGNEFWQGKKPTVIGHNMGDGYIGKTSYMNMFVNIADKDLRTAVSKDPKYIRALMDGEEAVNQYFGELIPDVMKDKQGGVSPFKNAVYYAEHGYVPTISSVSEPYIEKIIKDPSFAPAMHDDLKKLYEKDRLFGILNSMEDVGMDPYSPGIEGYYKKEYTFPEGFTVNGQSKYKISTMQTFDPKLVNENFVDINHVREIKRQNKIALFERLNEDALKQLEALKEVKGHEYDLPTLIAGQPHRKVEVYGYIDKRFLEEAKKANSDIKLLTAWGRGDTQKGLDTVLESFEKYVLEVGNKDKNTVLVLGGDLSGAADEAAIKKAVQRMNKNPEIRGRFAFLNGFAPNKPLASAADFAVFPSRFAPCELTDLESMKVFCSPIVTDCQGLHQKNFDARIAEEASKVTGYKTIHEYHESLEKLREALPEKSENKNILDRNDLEKAIKNFRNEIKEDYRIKHAGKEMTEEMVDKEILLNGAKNYDYNFKILRPFRDQVIAEDLTECYKRALIVDRNKEVQTSMVKNHLKQYTDWERNGALNASGESSAQRYRKLHFERESFAKVKQEDTLLYKLRERCKETGLFDRVQQDVSGNKPELSFGQKIKKFLSSKSGKWTMGVAGAIAIAGIGYKITKSKCKENPEKHLSAIV